MALEVTGSHQFSALFAWNARTTGVVSAEGMRPEVYDEAFVKAGRALEPQSLTFAPNEGQGSTAGRALPLDPLSALIRLSSELYALRQAAGSSSEASLSPLTVQLGARTLHLRLERGDDETVSSPFGQLRTEQFITKPSAPSEDDIEIRLWLAPEFRYAPVRVRVTQGATTALSFDLYSEPADFPAWR